MFKPLTKDNINGIMELLIASLNKLLDDRQLTVKVTDEARNYIIDAAYDPMYGARPLRRYLQKSVETLAAKLILSDELSEGDTILIRLNSAGALEAVKES
jgi:ATP-dependent Clp protease ATP-binding subunit ClpB